MQARRSYNSIAPTSLTPLFEGQLENEFEDRYDQDQEGSWYDEESEGVEPRRGYHSMPASATLPPGGSLSGYSTSDSLNEYDTYEARGLFNSIRRSGDTLPSSGFRRYNGMLPGRRHLSCSVGALDKVLEPLEPSVSRQFGTEMGEMLQNKMKPGDGGGGVRLSSSNDDDEDDCVDDDGDDGGDGDDGDGDDGDNTKVTSVSLVAPCDPADSIPSSPASFSVHSSEESTPVHLEHTTVARRRSYEMTSEVAPTGLGWRHRPLSSETYGFRSDKERLTVSATSSPMSSMRKGKVSSSSVELASVSLAVKKASVPTKYMRYERPYSQLESEVHPDSGVDDLGTGDVGVVPMSEPLISSDDITPLDDIPLPDDSASKPLRIHSLFCGPEHNLVGDCPFFGNSPGGIAGSSGVGSSSGLSESPSPGTSTVKKVISEIKHSSFENDDGPNRDSALLCRDSQTLADQSSVLVVTEPTEAVLVVTEPSEATLVVTEPTEAALVVTEPTEAALVVTEPTEAALVVTEPTEATLVVTEPTEAVLVVPEPTEAALVVPEPTEGGTIPATAQDVTRAGDILISSDTLSDGFSVPWSLPLEGLTVSHKPLEAITKPFKQPMEGLNTSSEQSVDVPSLDQPIEDVVKPHPPTQAIDRSHAGGLGNQEGPENPPPTGGPNTMCVQVGVMVAMTDGPLPKMPPAITNDFPPANQDDAAVTPLTYAQGKVYGLGTSSTAANIRQVEHNSVLTTEMDVHVTMETNNAEWQSLPMVPQTVTPLPLPPFPLAIDATQPSRDSTTQSLPIRIRTLRVTPSPSPHLTSDYTPEDKRDMQCSRARMVSPEEIRQQEDPTHIRRSHTHESFVDTQPNKKITVLSVKQSLGSKRSDSPQSPTIVVTIDNRRKTGEDKEKDKPSPRTRRKNRTPLFV